MSPKMILLRAAAAIVAVMALAGCDTIQREKTEPDVVFVTTPQYVVREMLKLADVSKGDVVYDLGSGDGRIVISAARDFGATGVGLEIDPKLIQESAMNAEKSGVSERVSFRKEDIFTADLSGATVVTLYLLPALNRALMPKLFKELQPGSRVVSHMWDMGDWKPDMTLKVDDSTVYFWWIPARVEGDWRMTMTAPGGTVRELSLSLDRNYQRVKGHLQEGSRKMAVKNGKLKGREIAFMIEGWMGGRWTVLQFTGAWDGATMSGTAATLDGVTGGSQPWTAVRVAQ